MPESVRLFYQAAYTQEEAMRKTQNRWTPTQLEDPKSYAFRYKCKACGSFSRLFVQCQPCLLKFIKANGVGERKQPEHF